MTILIRLLIAVGPLGLSLLIGWLLTTPYVSLGGGEKDVILAVPLLLWSLAHLITFVVMWARKADIRRSLRISAGLATAVVLLCMFALFGVSMFKSR